MYDDLYEALGELSTSQIKVDFRRDGEHSVVLSGLCSEGIVEVLRHLIDEMEWETKDIMEVVPQLKNISTVDLLSAALSGEGMDSSDILDALSKTSGSKSVSTTDEPQVGDVYSHSRKVVEKNYDWVTYEDDNGKRTRILSSSFKSWAKNKKKA